MSYMIYRSVATCHPGRGVLIAVRADTLEEMGTCGKQTAGIMTNSEPVSQNPAQVDFEASNARRPSLSACWNVRERAR